MGMISSVMTSVRAKPDPTAVAAVDAARAALLAEVDAADVGEHLGHVVEGDRVVTHLFACTRPGYVGWRWSVTVARASRQKTVTVDEVVLIPGDEAIVAPPWVPYRERIQPGDLSPGDLLPVADDDPRLVPTYSYGDDPLDTDDKAQVRAVAPTSASAGSARSPPEGRDLAAAALVRRRRRPGLGAGAVGPRLLHACGFLMRINGPLAELFGVCANGDANDDGRVVSFDHGCGAHSEVQLAKKHEPIPLPDPVVDTITPDEVETF